MVIILHFGFGEGGAMDQAPVDGLESFIDVALIQKIDERAGDHRLILRAHGEVGVVPAAENAQADEIALLQIDVLLRVLAAGETDLGGGHFGFVRSEFLIDLGLDGQAVAVPAGDVGRVEARHGFGLDDEILEYLVESGAQVNGAVGVGGTVVQDIGGPAGAGGADLAVEVLLRPGGEHFGLGHREVGLHGKVRARQVDGLLQV